MQSRAIGARPYYFPITVYVGGRKKTVQVQGVALVDTAGNRIPVDDLAENIGLLAKESRIQTEILLRILSGKNEELTRADVVALVHDQDKE